MPNFDSMMIELSRKNEVSYYNFINCSAKYSFTDGNHLYRDSAKDISNEIAKLIKKDKRNGKYRIKFVE